MDMWVGVFRLEEIIWPTPGCVQPGDSRQDGTCYAFSAGRRGVSGKGSPSGF